MRTATKFRDKDTGYQTTVSNKPASSRSKKVANHYLKKIREALNVKSI